MMNDLWAAALLVFLAGVFGTLSLALLYEAAGDWWRRRKVARRLAPVLSGRPTEGTSDVHDLVRSDEGARGFLSGLLQAAPGTRGLEVLLDQARMNMSLGAFLILSAGAGLAVGATLAILFESAFLALLGFLVAGSLPYFFAILARNRRFHQFEAEFPEGLDLLTRAIRAGHPLSSGMQMVGEEGPPEVAAEFRRAFEEQRFGIPFDEALVGLVDRTNMPDVRIFATAVLVQREVGGNLAEILENLADTIRRRFYLRRQLRVYTAQGRMTGYVLAALPILVGGTIFLIQPDYIMHLFSSLLGRILVGAAITLQLFGVLWIKQIVNIDI